MKRLAISGLLAILVSIPIFFAAAHANAQTVAPPLSSYSGNVPKETQDIITSNQAAAQGQTSLGTAVDNITGLQWASTGCILNSCPKPDGTQANTGVVQTIAGFVGGMYSNPPASSQAYAADVMKSLQLGGAQPAYAQGVGFSALNPILSVWKIMRNIAYFFFVVALLVIGIMIMLRQKIGSQAVVTAQQAIPSIIIALILVTFSYAIAGLLIDAMYLVMFLIAGLFGKVDLINGNVFSIAAKLVTGGAVDSSAQALGTLIESALGGDVFAQVAGKISGVGAYVIILVVIIFNTFKLFFALLNVYVELIINIAFSPVILMTGAVPGQNPFGAWLKNIIGNLAVFPVILLLLVMFDVIKNSISGTSGGFIPPYLVGGTLGLSSSASVLPFLAGLGLLLALPQAVDETKKAFGVQNAGFFGNLVQAGLKNFNERRGIGIGAASALTGATVGAGTGALIGGLTGTGTARERLRRAGRGAIVGTVAGGVGGPALASGLPLNIIRTAGREVIGATAAITTGNAVNTVVDRLDPQNKWGRTKNANNNRGTPPPAARTGKTGFNPGTPTP